MISPPKTQAILIVEDDSLYAQNIAIQLAEIGYGVVGILSNGEEAIAQIGLLKPDLILMDIVLAGSLDDIESACKMQLVAQIPVVFLTAFADRELVSRALAAGPFAYLQKPLKQRELELTLELALLRHRLQKQEHGARLKLEQEAEESARALGMSKQALQHRGVERRRDQRAMQRFSDAMDDSADAIYLIDRISMRFIDVNKAACERSGYSNDELLNMGPHDIKPAYTRPMLENQFDRIATTQERFGIIETSHRCKNDEIYPVEVRLRAIATDGRPIIVAIARDMTLQHQSEQALRQSEVLFRQITKNLQQLLWLRDVETRQLIYASDAFERIWGCTVEQVSKNPHDLFASVHPEDRVQINEAMRCVWSGKHSIDEEFRLLLAGGEIRWLRTRTFPILDDAGKVYRIGGVTEDITARKEDEEKLRISEEKFRLLFESSPIGLGLVSHDRRLFEVNPALADMLGYSQPEITGKTVDEITHPDDLEISLENIDQLFNRTAPVPAKEKRYLHKTGMPVWGKLNSTIVRDKALNPLFALGMIENIDQIKRAEHLRQSHEAKQKKALVREVHHRIKNHLQGVVGLMQQHAQLDSQCSGILETAIAQINVVATIHGLQCNEAGEDIDLLQLLGAIGNSVRKLIPAHPAAPVKFSGDTTLYLNREESVPIALALNELMVNALKHGAGPMEISLACDRDHAIICIENQCSAATEKISQGSGLELVHALLQTKGAAFSHELVGQRFLSRILLATPVIQLQRNAD